jgi:hypothetical protein
LGHRGKATETGPVSFPMKEGDFYDVGWRYKVLLVLDDERYRRF